MSTNNWFAEASSPFYNSSQYITVAALIDKLLYETVDSSICCKTINQKSNNYNIYYKYIRWLATFRGQSGPIQIVDHSLTVS